MKPGSLVVCVSNSRYSPAIYILPVIESKTYTVRTVVACSCGCKTSIITLEEIKNKYFMGGELSYTSEDFREVLPAEAVNLEELLREEVPA